MEWVVLLQGKTISKLIKVGLNPIGAKVSILGLTFKEDCPDLKILRFSQ